MRFRYDSCGQVFKDFQALDDLGETVRIPLCTSSRDLAVQWKPYQALGELALDAVTLGAGSAAKATAATVFKRSAKVSKGRRKIQQLAKVMATATGAKKANRLTVVARAVEKASRDVVKSFLRLRAGFRPLHRSPQALAQAKKVNRGLRSSHARKKTLSKIFEVQRHLQKELRKKGIALSRSTPNNADVWKKVGQAMDLRDQLGRSGEHFCVHGRFHL
ncbi:ANKRD17 [Symbiodinium necroappetens]|uniref:ANKRD17 protein n=1 Tax=Symbiodinium necroappetens TaxID=1628268 RepID=A0A812N5Z1_9DINO|nr:ANKRD17 [Symbiodinium necroappetens]